MLNILTVDSKHKPLSAPQLATLLDIVHDLAPDYTLRKYQCYWFALIIYLVVKRQTKGEERSGAEIMHKGHLYYLKPEHTADLDMAVAEDEYTKAWNDFDVSN